MTYKSGRQYEQGIGACVVEEDTIYVTPRRFAAMKNIELREGMHDRPMPYWVVIDMLEAAGWRESLYGLRPTGYRIVVDYELDD